MAGFLFLLGWTGIFLVSLFGIVFSVLPGFILSEYHDIVETLAINDFNFRIALFCISFFYLILFFVKLLSVTGKKEERAIVASTEKGTIGISLTSIENLAKGVIKGYSFVKDSKVKAVLKKENVFLNINLGVSSNDALNNETKNMQEMVINYVQKVSGLKVEGVNITITKLDFSTSIKEVGNGE